MQKFYETITTSHDGVLIPLAGATVTVKLAGTATLAALYSDNGVSVTTNPVVSGATGLVEFYAADARYDLEVVKAGYAPFTLSDILLEDPANDVISALSNVAITTSTFVGGAIDNVTLGATTPSTGKFTSVTLASGATGSIALGELRLNSVENTLDVGLGQEVVGQMFEETFITVKNLTGATMTSGQVVGFSGVDTVNALPYAHLVDADPSFEPLLTIGIVTQTIANGSSGRATVFGKVRDLDTTGASVGEVWVAGDLLYIHPTIPGKLTKTEPTVPNVSVLVAAVLRVHATAGVILVRVQPSRHLHYAAFTSLVPQVATAPLTPTIATFESTATASGVTIVANSKVYPNKAGLYVFRFSAQLTKSNASVGYAWVWARVNGVDVPASATKVSVAGSGSEVVPAWSFTLALGANDYFELVWAVDQVTVFFDAVAAETFCPAIPSIALSVAQINQ